MCWNSDNEFQLEPRLAIIGTKIWPELELFRNAVLTLIIHDTAEIHVLNCQLIIVL